MAAGIEAAARPGGPGVRVWDPVVRAFHWITVVGCVLDLGLLEEGETPHRLVGYVLAAVLAIRILWGFVGTRHARFADFIPAPRRLAGYLRDLPAGRARDYVGHNPAGAVMMLALMALLAVVAVTGIMTTTDTFWGVAWVEGLHEAAAEAIIPLALVHAAVAILESLFGRVNLVAAMVTGRKRWRR